MCGLTALFAHAPAAGPVCPDELASISQRLAARGPDASGAWIEPAGRVGLAHRRLSIQDLDARADQPFADASGRFVLVYNGELYNAGELRRELEADGCRLRTSSDSELLVELFARRGPGALERLRGMFAFVVWDTRERRLFAARDPYGIKPLYWRDRCGELALASQVRALSPTVAEPDAAALVGFLLFGSVPEPFTWDPEVRALPPGGWLEADERGVVVHGDGREIARRFGAGARAAVERERDPELRGDRRAQAERAAAALEDSVGRHLNVADVPAACFLSGGIDSSAILALAAQSRSTAVATLTLAFEEYRGRADDEAPLAARTAAHFGAEHTTYTLGKSEFEADLPRILDAMDQPSIDGINTWFVSKACREVGFKVALSGLGGDELLGGYPSFRELPRLLALGRGPAAVPGLGRLARAGLAPFARRQPKLAGVVEHSGDLAGAYLLKRGLFLPHELPALIGPERAAAGLARLGWFESTRALIDELPADLPARIAALESSLYMRNQLLRDADWASMAQGLELRVPLVDTALLAELAPLVFGSGFEPGKRLLAEAPRDGLPRELRERQKTGFTVPTAGWIDAGSCLDGWRAVPSLARDGVPQARRLAWGVLTARGFEREAAGEANRVWSAA